MSCWQTEEDNRVTTTKTIETASVEQDLYKTQQNRHGQEDDKEKKKNNLTLSKWNTLLFDQKAEVSGRIHTSHLN